VAGKSASNPAFRPSADSIASAHALKRLGTPEDIAGIAAHLVADDAAWITGQIIGVDGGRGNISV